jgi:hypothetical protein
MHALRLGRLGEPARADLVAERAVAEDGVGADEQERAPLERLGRVLVGDEVGRQAGVAEILAEVPPLLVRGPRRCT